MLVPRLALLLLTSQISTAQHWFNWPFGQPSRVQQQQQQPTTWLPQQQWLQPSSSSYQDERETVSQHVPLTATQPHFQHVQERSTNLPQSPCPDVFSYELDARYDVWVGVASVTAPIDRTTKQQTIITVVNMTLNSNLPSHYAGRLELYDDKSLVAARLAADSGEPLRYRIRFPVKSPLPYMNSIAVNDQIVCWSDAASDVILGGRTTLTLNHKLSLVLDPSAFQQPAIVRPAATPSFNPTVFQTSPRPRPTQFTTTRPPPTAAPTVATTLPPRTSLANTDLEQCGTKIASVSLIVDGNETRQGEWPWLAAMFAKTDTGLDFKCGGSLVSTNHVLTAAHCVVVGTYGVRNADSVLVYLGKYSLRSWTETNAQPRDLRKIVVHPDYESSTTKDNDLAVLVLIRQVTLTNIVIPVCLWRPDQKPPDKDGTVVGWGRDEHGNSVSDRPKSVSMPLVSQEECLRSHHNFHYLTSDKTICAGRRDGSGPCSGDSGSGLYFDERSGDGSVRWYLRGLVSLSLQNETTKLCDLYNYVVFTDLSKFTPWLHDVMTSNR